MLSVYTKTKEGIKNSDLSVLKTKSISWVDCLNPTDKELEELSKKTKVPLSELKDHLSNYERPNTFDLDAYSLLVVGVPVTTKSKSVRIASLATFILNNNNIITLRTQEMECIDKLAKNLIEKNPNYFSTQTTTVRILLELIIDDFFKHLADFEEKAEKIESNIIHNPENKYVEDVFRIKKKLLFFHKALLANREVVVAIEKAYVKKISRKELYEFRDLYNDIVQLIDTEETIREVLSGTMNIYMSSVSNNLNQIIKKLTVVASYVLIPTLIASIYGMNFRFMPELGWVWGYPFALGIMVTSILAMYIYFRKARWI